jgi:hypothetical protein
MDILSSFRTPIIGFLVTVVFGFWLGKIGKPCNDILFNIHKLIALGIVIIASLQVYKIFKVIEPKSLLLVSLIGVVICVLALFASGAFLSIGNVKYETAKLVHNIALAGVVITRGSSMVLLSGVNI